MTDSQVTSSTFPRLFECLETISYDAGGPTGQPAYGVPPRWVRDLGRMEAAVAALTADERETFCIGDEDEQEAIASRSADLKQTSLFLNDFFEDWSEEPYEKGQRSNSRR